MTSTQKTVTLTITQWAALREMIDLGTSYDCDGCEVSTSEEKTDEARITMEAVRALAEQLAGWGCGPCLLAPNQR